jgi:hypothetical protein
MSKNAKKTARMPAMKFPKLQKRLRAASVALAKPVARLPKPVARTEKGPVRNRKRFP